jgi:hypothetical protein
MKVNNHPATAGNVTCTRGRKACPHSILIMKRFLFAFLCLFWSVNQTKAQIITTIAGTGGSTFSGENVSAITAGIPNPGGGKFDKHGNYYFVDGVNSHRVRRITPLGIISSVAGNGMAGFAGDGGPATSARLNGPTGIALDTFGNIYVSDGQNNRIRRIDKLTGVISTVAGTGVGGFGPDGVMATASMIWGPSDICIDRLNNIYIADGVNSRVRKISSTGIISTVAGIMTAGYSGDYGPATNAQLGLPSGVAVDDTGNIFIADNGTGSSCIRKVDISGIITTFAGNGASSYVTDGIPATVAQICPNKICCDSVNNLFVSDRYNNRVYKIDVFTNLLTCIAGIGVVGDSGDGGPATSATLNYPSGVAVDACGNLYVPTVGSVSVVGSGRRIRKVTFNPGGIGTISIAVTPNDTVCAGTVVTFTATTTGASTMGYQWYKNGVAVPGATNATYSYTATTVEGGDSVRCVYTGIDVCSIAGNPGSNVLHIVATPLTMPTIAVSSVASATLGSVVTVNATVGSAGGSYSIKWYKNSSLFATTSVPTATYIKGTGTDVITARVSSTAATGCYDTATSSAISIAQDPVQVLQPQATVVVEVYPNPATHNVAVEAGASIKGITITNAAGQVFDVPQTQMATNRHVLDIANLPVGVYLLQVTDEYGGKVVKRVVKR